MDRIMPLVLKAALMLAATGPVGRRCRTERRRRIRNPLFRKYGMLC
jgi:hypothetical protein